MRSHYEDVISSAVKRLRKRASSARKREKGIEDLRAQFSSLALKQHNDLPAGERAVYEKYFVLDSGKLADEPIGWRLEALGLPYTVCVRKNEKAEYVLWIGVHFKGQLSQILERCPELVRPDIQVELFGEEVFACSQGAPISRRADGRNRGTLGFIGCSNESNTMAAFGVTNFHVACTAEEETALSPDKPPGESATFMLPHLQEEEDEAIAAKEDAIKSSDDEDDEDGEEDGEDEDGSTTGHLPRAEKKTDNPITQEAAETDFATSSLITKTIDQSHQGTNEPMEAKPLTHINTSDSDSDSSIDIELALADEWFDGMVETYSVPMLEVNSKSFAKQEEDNVARHMARLQLCPL